MTSAKPKAPSFAEVLNLLFEASARADPDRPGKFIEYTNKEIADEINRRHGDGTITTEYIRKLRQPNGPKPTLPYASVLADVFQVDLDVFNALGGDASNKLVREAQRRVRSRRRTRHADDQDSEEVAVLARTARRLAPAAMAKAVRYVRTLSELQDMEDENESTVSTDTD
ncbi:hypothetical protein AB0I69_42830 [Streptomyces sp. NPDC050508]|uniref:hypothetical protein n=1 Tax=Streptomyces sp. NPDC050508 TaxID=3155405 RepID=UPI0034142E6C